MKVIIPVAGAGLRLRPHTYTQPKPLIPVAGKAILATIIDRLILEPQLDTIVLVIGYLGDKIQTYVQERYPNLNIEFVYQEQRLGLGHAIYTARQSFAEEDEILIVLGDIIFDGNLADIIQCPHSCLGVKKVEDPRDFGVVELGDDQSVRRLVEKPRIPKSNLALVGLYKIKEVTALIKALQYNIEHNIRTRDEFQLTDALMLMHEQGTLFTIQHLETWFDCGKKEILLETNALLLRSLAYATPTYAQQFENSIIIPPVCIGNNCNISSSIIGPNVSIGDNATLTNAIIANSIIGNFASIEEAVLHKSIIGNDTSIKGKCQSLNIGDNTEIDFN
jgi:glucose-1-phosphate thymidylyltransferase